MTLRPLWSASDTSLPSASGRVKAGASSPGVRRALIGLVSSYVHCVDRVPGSRVTGGPDSAARPEADRLSGTGNTADRGGDTVADTADTRTPAQIEADIARRRAVLAETLDEIGVRVHPKTIVGDAKARVVSNVDHTLGRAYVGVNSAVSEVKAQFVDETGSPRLERVVPVGLLVVGVVGLLALGGRRRRR
nr:DUF3618 domain-containing protein [Actinospica acidiphila]